MTFGQFIKKLRTDRNLTLRGFADEIKLHFSYVNKMERGLVPTKDSTLFQISERLGLLEQEELEMFFYAGLIHPLIKQKLLCDITLYKDYAQH